MSETNIPEQDPQFSQHFIDTVSAVDRYNNQHTGIASSMRGIVGMMLGQVSEHTQPAVSAAEEAQMAKEMVQFLSIEALNDMGVTLADIGSDGLKMLDYEQFQESGDEPSTLFLVITNGDKFADTVRQLRPAPEQKEQVDANLNSLLSRTVSIVQEAYGKPADEHSENVRRFGTEQLNMFQELTPALAQSGFTELPAYQKLSEYAARFAAGTLDDYRGAERIGLLDPGFGPDSWQKDASPDFLATRWNKAFSYLKQLREQDQPTAYYTELFTKLRGDFSKAQAWLDDESAHSTYPTDYISQLKKQMTELAPVWDEQFALENGMYSSDSEQS